MNHDAPTDYQEIDRYDLLPLAYRLARSGNTEEAINVLNVAVGYPDCNGFELQRIARLLNQIEATPEQATALLVNLVNHPAAQPYPKSTDRQWLAWKYGD